MMTAAGFSQSKYNASLYHKGRDGGDNAQARGGGADGAAATGRREAETWHKQARGGGAYGAAVTGRRKVKMETFLY